MANEEIDHRRTSGVAPSRRSSSDDPAPRLLPGAVTSLVLGLAFFSLGHEIAEGDRIRADRWIIDGLHRHTGNGWTRFMHLATDLGSAYVTVPLMLAFVGWLLWSGRRQLAYAVAAFWIGAQLIDLVTKPLYHRDRPSFFPALVKAGGFSFPSGHTVTAVMTYGLIATVLAYHLPDRWRWLPIVLAAVIVVAVATSRVYLGVHYPSDVIGGVLIGGAWLQIAIIVLDRIEHRRTTTPSAKLAG